MTFTQSEGFNLTPKQKACANAYIETGTYILHSPVQDGKILHFPHPIRTLQNSTQRHALEWQTGKTMTAWKPDDDFSLSIAEIIRVRCAGNALDANNLFRLPENIRSSQEGTHQ